MIQWLIFSVYIPPSCEQVILIISKQSLAQQRGQVTWVLNVCLILISISISLSSTLYVLIIMISLQPVGLCYLNKMYECVSYVWMTVHISILLRCHSWWGSNVSLASMCYQSIFFFMFNDHCRHLDCHALNVMRVRSAILPQLCTTSMRNINWKRISHIRVAHIL